jgi:hypothetical protein
VAKVHRARSLALALVAGLAVTVAAPTSARPADKQEDLRAYLDGKPIALAEVGNWYCHDFNYPVILCFSDPQDGNASTTAAMAATAGVTYVTVYEYTTYQGAYMHMSENYPMLSLLGWNDRISSFQVKNGMSGAFWTDWLYGGSRYNFCCNQGVGSLGGWDNIFSSVFHN